MKTNLFHIEARNGRVKLDDDVNPWSTKELLEDIEKLYGNAAVEAQMQVGDFIAAADDALETVTLEINSPGGSVTDGYRIYHALQEMKGRGVRVEGVINGKAASMATVILMAADSVSITKGSLMLVHDASTATYGKAEDHRKAAETLEQISAEIAEIYAAKTGESAGDMRALMGEDRWMTAGEAHEIGLVDRIITGNSTIKDSLLDANANKLQKQPNCNMSILDKLRPDAAQAAKLEGVEAENTTLRGELEEAKTLITDAAAEVADFKAQLDAARTEADALKATVEAKDLEITESAKALKAEQEKTTPEAIQALVTEAIAGSGHPPIEEPKEEQTVIGQSVTETYEKLEGAEKWAFLEKHKSELHRAAREAV
jgi:ATP-dependent Clp endopeptidase proteolytic subunit ClpP